MYLLLLTQEHCELFGGRNNFAEVYPALAKNQEISAKVLHFFVYC